jgi:hypothetical protein
MHRCYRWHLIFGVFPNAVESLQNSSATSVTFRIRSGLASSEIVDIPIDRNGLTFG